MTLDQILAEAVRIYERTQHTEMGCCGDLAGALEFIDGAVGELLTETYQEGIHVGQESCA